MQLTLWTGYLLVLGLLVGAPPTVLAHVGHGDEFQAEGGVNRVQVNPETDSLMGIEVTPIAPAADGSAAVLIPVTSLVDDNGRQLVFVRYENFYEPVPVITGATQREYVEITEGLSVGEDLVTQGSLSLYAESRKTQNAESITSADITHTQADAQGIPHSHLPSGGIEVGSTAQAPQAERSPSMGLATLGGGAVLLVGSIVIFGGRRKRKRPFSGSTGNK